MPTFRDDPKLGGMVPMMKTDDINDQAITKDKIRDGNVTTEKLADGAVSTDKLPDGAIKTSKIADENITTEKLADGTVETSKIADQNVTKEKIADQSVDNSKLSPEAVTYDKLKDKSVITEKLNDRAVTTEKLEEKAVTNPKLGDQSVNGRVVQEASLETKHFANESVTTEKVARKSITKDKLADNSVDASQVVDGSIGNAKLSPDSVTTEKIKDRSVTNEKVANDALGIEKFDPELRKTIQAATGLPDDLSQMIQDVDKSVKQLKEKDTDLQSRIDDKQQQITSNDEDISLLQTRSTQMEEAIKGISASGGASVASAVTYDNTESGLDSITAQGAIDELANKKFDKENIAQEFGESDDKVVSQFALPFREIESPEFLHCIVDAEDHFLLGIQLDGSIEWGKGIPAPIRAKLQEIINQCQQDKTDVLEAVNAAKDELSASIAALQEGKVDKEEGKSLIEDEVKECFKVIENEEFIKAVVDADDKVLFGFYRATGKPYYPLNEMYHVEQNEEFFALWLDAANHVLLGIRRDGQIIGEFHAVNALKQVISQLQSDLSSLQEDVKDFLDIFSLQDNEEYLAVEQDAEGKVLSTTNADGSHYIHNAKSETIPTEFEHIEDPEGRMGIVTDAEDKVLAYRDSDGTMHENSFETKTLTVNGVEYQETLNQCKREFIDAINNIELSEINGIEDHGKENLYTGYTKRYTTADGKQTFISPNESLGGVFCNPIRCSAGEFFTRTGIATAIVVVSDKNDNNAQRVYQPSGALPGNTFQIPETWDWAYYLRCVCMSTDRELAIMRGKYAIKKSEQDGKLRIPEMKLSIANFTKDTKYISSPNGKMYEIAVDNDGQLYAKEIDKDVIFPSDVPSNFKFTLVNNLSKGEKLPFDRFITNIDSYVGVWNSNGVCAYKDLSPVTLNANWEYHKNSNGEGRYMCVNGYDAEGFPKGFSVYNEQFELVDNVVGKFDNHDYIYIDDGHYILFNETIHQVIIDGKEYTPKIPTIYEYKNGEVIAQRLLNDQIIMNDLAPTDYYRSETHVNTLGFDGEDQTRIIINPRHCMSFFILERNISSDGSVTFGNIVAQIGGLRSANHYDVDSRIKTEDKCQWFLCHDVKKWGTKNINGKNYPVYTLFDNNLQDALNVNNPSGGQPSRIIQMAIDFENKKIIEYKIYQIEEYKSDIMSSAFMFDEGKIFINYARQPICGYYDFTTAATNVSENTYTGAVKKLEFHSGTNTPYRVNPFNV